ncbi:MAG: hypothetical protein HFE78_07340 [Clostridiales bacterium]|nr:hypothetical protein [Clostridiales bacterium]
MGIRVFNEYTVETQKVIKEYEKKFDTDFPVYFFEYQYTKNEIEKKIIEVITKCLESGKDVYDLGYLNVKDDTLY